MFENIPMVQVTVFGRDGFQARKSGLPATTFRGMFIPRHVEITINPKTGLTFETHVEAVGLLTSDADAADMQKDDTVAPPSDLANPRKIAARRDDGWGMTLLILRKGT